MIEIKNLKKQYKKAMLKRIWLNILFYFPFIDVDGTELQFKSKIVRGYAANFL